MTQDTVDKYTLYSTKNEAEPKTGQALRQSCRKGSSVRLPRNNEVS